MLYKEELKKVPLCELPKVSKEELKGKDYIAGTEIIELQRCGKTLIIDYYSIKNHNLQVRFFSDGENFIVYDVENKKWSKSFVNTLLYRPSKDKNYHNIDVVCTKVKTDMAGRFLNKTTDTYCFVDLFGQSYNYRSFSGILGVADRFIKELRSEAKSRSEDKAEAVFRERQLWFPKPDEDTDRFCNEKCFEEKYIFFSNLKSNKKRDCVCSVCNATWELSEKPKHKGYTECPHCKAKAVWWSDRYQSCIKNESNLCTVHKRGNDFIMRWNNIGRTFYQHKPYIKYYDDAYTFYLEKNGEYKPTSYFYTEGYMGYGLHWTKERKGETCYHPTYVYTKNLGEVFGDNFFNVNIKTTLENSHHKLNFIRLLKNIKEIPQAEYLCKFGLTTLAAELKATDYQEGGSFERIMGVSKQYMPMYRKYDIGAAEHRIISSAKGWISEDDFIEFRSLGIDPDHYDRIQEILPNMTMKTFCRYVKKQMLVSNTNPTPSKIVIWLADYYSMCDNLDIKITKDLARPKELKKAHDMLVKRYEEVKAEIRDAKSKAALELVNHWFKGYEKDGFCIIVPQYKSDFIREGQILGHCVGNSNYYYDKHIAGEKMIFFIRKTESKDTPYVTAEIDMHTFRIMQCYAKGNSTPKPVVNRFVKEFCQWLKLQGAKLERKAG